tara:strand:- start:843 stop:1637 length:795 start_codon:yes stop_codon:yes gene_type:complete
MKLSQKLFIAIVASVGFANVANATDLGGTPGGSPSTFTLDTASFGLGVDAPSVNVGTSALQKGTFTYRTSVGTSDNFSVGTVSAMGASSSASSTPDYNVNATADFSIAATSQINQAIGGLQIDNIAETTNGDVTTTTTNYRGRKKVTTVDPNNPTQTVDNTVDAGKISGTFAKTFTNTADSENNVTVEGVGTSTAINLGSDASFTTTIQKAGVTDASGNVAVAPSDITSGSAGTANGSANGTVNTSTSASASNSQFVSSFIQAY